MTCLYLVLICIVKAGLEPGCIALYYIVKAGMEPDSVCIHAYVYRPAVNRPRCINHYYVVLAGMPFLYYYM